MQPKLSKIDNSANTHNFFDMILSNKLKWPHGMSMYFETQSRT